MGRNTPVLACGSLFIEKIENIYTAKDATLLKKAYGFSRQRESDRDSSPFKAAEMLIDQGADAETVACALVAPHFWQGRVKPEEIREHVSQDVADTLAYLKQPFSLRIDTEIHRRKDINALLVSMSETPRAAILLIVFRLIELETTLESQGKNPCHMAQETLHFYVPIADRLSLGEMRRRLEDVCFRILHPFQYEKLKQDVTPIQSEDEKCLEILIEGVKRLLDKNRIHAEVHGRAKSLYSIHLKMTLKGTALEDIMDRIGLRIIVSSVPECYAVLGLLHTHFKPIPGTFDDYIGLPKDNGYQSLHTCVYPMREVTHKPIEFQVRTELMHMEAEHGSAAHWLYKSAVAMGKDSLKNQWLKGLVRRHDQAKSTDAFIELLRRQVCEDHMVVFGKGGRITRLPDKATVLEYLDAANFFASRSSVVKVNGKLASLDQTLRDGDSIEIVDCEDSASPGTVADDMGDIIGQHKASPMNTEGCKVWATAQGSILRHKEENSHASTEGP
ncbi:MAG TPA: HD domain-containing protein [Syntrophales bacterium]|nr:HD domain-containing protein [Syntrophales bacterium]